MQHSARAGEWGGVSSFRRLWVVRLMPLMIVFAGLMSACQPTVRDVSHEAGYAALMGQTYRIVGEVDAVAIRRPDEAASYMILDARPSLTGPEVAFKRALPQGQIFKVTGVQRRDNILDNVVYLIVDMTPNPVSPPLSIRITLKDYDTAGVGQLNPKLYQRVQ